MSAHLGHLLIAVLAPAGIIVALTVYDRWCERRDADATAGGPKAARTADRSIR